MKTISIFFAYIFLSPQLFAQDKVLLALKVFHDPEYSNKHWYLRVEQPAGIKISKGQKFVLKGTYKKTDQDTLTKGSGMVSYIDGHYIQCEMTEAGAIAEPMAGDLCFFIIPKDKNRKDVFYRIGLFNISFLSLAGDTLFNAINSFSGWSEEKAGSLIARLKEDIVYTGAAMLKQNDSQQQLIKDGDFKGSNLFDAMTAIKEGDVMNFLRYVWARPVKYSGGAWHISEVFATWMTSGTPKLNGEISY